jgi:hypothetical protein
MFNGAGAMRSSGLVPRNAVPTANARRSYGVGPGNGADGPAQGTGQNSPAFPPPACGFQEAH